MTHLRQIESWKAQVIVLDNPILSQVRGGNLVWIPPLGPQTLSGPVIDPNG